MKRLEKKKKTSYGCFVVIYPSVTKTCSVFTVFLSKVMYHLVFGHVISYTSPDQVLGNFLLSTDQGTSSLVFRFVVLLHTSNSGLEAACTNLNVVNL